MRDLLPTCGNVRTSCGLLSLGDDGDGRDLDLEAAVLA